MQDILLKYVNQQLSNLEESDQQFKANDDLLGSGILDSLGMMKLILFIEKEFNIKVPAEDMTIENFMTISHINDYLLKR